MNKFFFIILSVFATFIFSYAGELYDGRDGQVYKTVKIGGQEWMAENLNYEVNDGEQSWCYNNKKSNCKKYGRYYFFEQAETACPSGWHLPSNDEFQHLLEFAGRTSKHKAGSVLKSKKGWSSYTYCTDPNCDWDEVYESDCDCKYRLKTVSGNGRDALGFNALETSIGLSDYEGGVMFNVGDVPGTCFWSSTIDENLYYCLAIYSNDETELYVGNERDGTLGSPNVAYSVRCVRDE